MKLATHYIFSAGLISLVLSFISKLSFPYIFLISFFVSFVGNRVIDGLGHEMVSGWNKLYPRRTPLTHTIPRSVLWGIAVVAPLLFIIYFFGELRFFFPVLIAGVIVGPSHMILDIFTEAGIYVKKNGKWKRIALAHFAYNDPFVNSISSVLGLLMLFFAFSLHN